MIGKNISIKNIKNNKNIKNIKNINTVHNKIIGILAIALVIISFFATGCASQEPEKTMPQNLDKRVVQITMQDGSKMVFELYPEYAPETVENFVTLAQSGFYNGLTFHRIMKGFMIQGGDPKGNGTGGSDQTIKGEFAANGYKQNTLKHTKGVISMARSGNPNSASSQFFIMHGEHSSLDGKYAAFGKLIEGENTLDKIAETPVVPNPNSPQQELSSPTVDVVMKEVTVLK